MSEKSIIIIGAGVAGLTTGIYACLNGYKAQIFEMDIKPGGLCTAWERKGYVIDGCLHWLVGTSPKSSYHKMWQDVGVLNDKKIIDMEQFFRFEDKDGKAVTIYTDMDKLEKHLIEVAPEDTAYIREITSAVRRFTKFDPPADKPAELYNPIDSMKALASMAPYMADMKKWGKMTVKEMSARFNSPLLRKAFSFIWPMEFTAISVIMTLAWLASKNGGYIIGGSMEIALSLEKRFYELGGKLKYNSRVEKILVENGIAVGVKLESGQEVKADYVVSAADGYTTIFEMLEGKYTDDTVKGYYQNIPAFKPLVYVGLGVYNMLGDFPQIISGLTFQMDKPIKVDNTEHEYLSVRVHNFDPSLASEGKTVLTAAFMSDFDYWAELSKDEKAYKAEKERIAVAVVSALNKRFPRIARDLEMWDVATPLTFYRYTGNWKGSMEGWLLTPENLTLQMKKTLPGLENFYMAGQWVSPGGGLPAGLITGNHVVQLICKKDRINFKTTAK